MTLLSPAMAPSTSPPPVDEVPAFDVCLAEHHLPPLRARGIEVLQLNLGRLCNMSCAHCHVDAGPNRKEVMSAETATACIRALAQTEIPTLDLTGGAPEMNPNFQRFVGEARSLNRHVIDRSNLTVFALDEYAHLPEFLAEHQVEIVASLPCYLEKNVDAQRGRHSFATSIEVLQRLNSLGYGQPTSELVLTLVYNPTGATLPPSQAALESAYRTELAERYGIVFTRLIAMANMPIGRALSHFIREGRYNDYMRKLHRAFNPAAAEGVMCRNTLSVDWQGRLYDCDFNQAIRLRLLDDLPRNVHDFQYDRLSRRPIATGLHCYGCTAGSGSSCSGAVVVAEHTQ